jgi:predicted dehydrogenase
MKKIKIGISGTGVGIRTHLSGFRLVPDAEVVAISGSSLARSQEFAQKYSIPIACADYKELCDIEELDLVCVTTPNRLHNDMVSYALKKDKNVICEKPLSDDINEVRSLIQQAKRHTLIQQGKGKITIVDHQLRYNPYIQEIKRLIDSGTLGKVYAVRLNQQGTGFAKENAAWSWSFDGAAGGGVRLAMATHFTDLIQYWFNSPKIMTVSGYLNPITKTRSDASGEKRNVEASTVCNVQILFANELTVQYSINAGSYVGSRFEISMFGDKGELTFSLQDKLALYLRSAVGTKQDIDLPNVYHDEKENKASIFSGSFRYFAPLIVKAIQTGDISPIAISATFDDAEYNISLLNAIKKSANTGMLVTLSTTENEYV